MIRSRTFDDTVLVLPAGTRMHRLRRSGSARGQLQRSVLGSYGPTLRLQTAMLMRSLGRADPLQPGEELAIVVVVVVVCFLGLALPSLYTSSDGKCCDGVEMLSLCVHIKALVPAVRSQRAEARRRRREQEEAEDAAQREAEAQRAAAKRQRTGAGTSLSVCLVHCIVHQCGRYPLLPMWMHVPGENGVEQSSVSAGASTDGARNGFADSAAPMHVDVNDPIYQVCTILWHRVPIFQLPVALFKNVHSVL